MIIIIMKNIFLWDADGDMKPDMICLSKCKSSLHKIFKAEEKETQQHNILTDLMALSSKKILNLVKRQ